MAAFVLGACSSSNPGGGAPPSPMSYPFGPFDVAPAQEIATECVQITLNNENDLYVNAVELNVGGPGFHHSNWFWVPEGVFSGSNGSNSAADDGTYTCTDRGFDQALAAIDGGVLFAQSTQIQDETQKFQPGMVIHIPPHAKLVAQLHILNPSEATLHITPAITLTPIAESAVTTMLHAIAFEDEALGLPPNQQSQFTVDCDLSTAGNGASPSFNIYYALAHYHALGTGLELDAAPADDATWTTVFTTSAGVGDSLGGPLDPPFAMGSNTHLKFSCDYFNDTPNTVEWGLGNQEMCVFLAFTDSPDNWSGGVLVPDPPGDPTVVDGVDVFTHSCAVIAAQAN